VQAPIVAIELVTVALQYSFEHGPNKHMQAVFDRINGWLDQLPLEVRYPFMNDAE
jgi:hypothetical protein